MEANSSCEHAKPMIADMVNSALESTTKDAFRNLNAVVQRMSENGKSVTSQQPRSERTSSDK